jgi:para-aminobenzoate synthetase component 1
MNITEKNFKDFKTKMLNWANRFSIFCLLDNNGYSFEDSSFECLLAVGCVKSYAFTGDNDFKELQSFFDTKPTWLFGHLGYNAGGTSYKKNKTSEDDFGDGFFFEPEIILKFSADKIEVVKSNRSESDILYEIEHTDLSYIDHAGVTEITSTISKEEYNDTIKALHDHIQRGDCYEINFCQQFTAHDACIHPVEIYGKLSSLSPAPFGAMYKLDSHYCLCASPERFLQKKGMQLISQPIKGTTKRETDPIKDKANKDYLNTSTKEKSENVMVVDLVRNDMSRVCKKGSVRVKELFGVYSFPQVHQMISTVEGILADDKKFTEAIEACYPMGSMTGAPKKRVMELIEQYEHARRGLFSGSIGYITPDGDFDLNVVIRSIFYCEAEKKISFFAGGGITFYSKAADEYEESLMKAKAIFNVLGDDIGKVMPLEKNGE